MIVKLEMRLQNTSQNNPHTKGGTLVFTRHVGLDPVFTVYLTKISRIPAIPKKIFEILQPPKIFLFCKYPPPPKILIFLKIIVEIIIFEPPKMGKTYVYMKILEYLPPGPSQTMEATTNNGPPTTESSPQKRTAGLKLYCTGQIVATDSSVIQRRTT